MQFDEMGEPVTNTAPIRTFPQTPRLVLGSDAVLLEWQSRYIVPLVGGELEAAIRRAVHAVPRLFVTEYDEDAAYIGNHAIAGVGYEVIVLRFHDAGSGRTRIDAVDRGVTGTLNWVGTHLGRLLTALHDELAAPEPTPDPS
jgi:hypothetical protein